MGLSNLPKAKWQDTGNQVILKQDFIDIEEAILEKPASASAQPLKVTLVDVGTVKVSATTDSTAAVSLQGFPNVFHPGLSITGASDKILRTNTASVNCIFGIAEYIWGSEKPSQWYAIYAIANTGVTTFALKAMPWLVVKSQSLQVISLGTMLAPGTGIGYGFTTDELADSSLYVLTGASRGMVRTITNNNNDNGTAGTITYSGTALSVAQGDLMIILPDTNYCYLGDAYNNASSNITYVTALALLGGRSFFTTAVPFPAIFPEYYISGTGGGGASSVSGAGWAGGVGTNQYVSMTPALVQVSVGAGGAYAGGIPYPGVASAFGAGNVFAGGAAGSDGVPAHSVTPFGAYGAGAAAGGNPGGAGFVSVQW